MSKIKKLASLLLAVVMILSAPITVLAETNNGFELTASTTTFYNGMSYDVTARITDATYSEAFGNSAFSWSINQQDNGASVISKNNYSVTDNGDDTYTVTETAAVIMPSAGNTATVTASLGSRTKSLNMTSQQAIESFSVDFVNNSHAYYDSNTNTLYIDREASVDFSVTNIEPDVSDDEITVLLESIPYGTLKYDSGSYNLEIAKNATGTGIIRFSTRSGKTLRTVNVQICVATASYRLTYNPFNAVSSQYAMVDSEQRIDASIAAVAGKPFSITAGSFSSGANDEMEYVLYTDAGLTNKAQSNYYTVVDRTCELSIDVAGTYYLTTRNCSKDNGKLDRTLGMIVTQIYVSSSFPIQSMNLYKLDSEQNKTDEILESLVLYTNASTSASTYNLTNSLTVDPVYHTDEVTFMSSDAKIAKVDSKTGLVTAVSKGTATIWVMSRDNAAAITSVDVTVKIGIKAITGITKADGTVNIPSGHVEQLIATTNPAVVDEPIYWSTSNPDVLAVDAKTGVITAKAVTKKTPAIVYATTESGTSVNTPINVVPANRVTTLTLGATCESNTFENDVYDNHILYSDYYLGTESSRKPIIVSADYDSQDSSPITDSFVWTISYDKGEAMSMDDAASAGIATITKLSDTSYSIIPKYTGRYVVKCVAAENIETPKDTDQTDYIFIDMLPRASTISVKDAKTNANITEPVVITVGSTKEITVKTSTTDNNKTVDPPTYKIVSGPGNINIQQAPSADGEGITYTIEALSYSTDESKITFASKSGSKSYTIEVLVKNDVDGFELETNSTSLYNGMSYDVVARITNATEEQALNNSAFTWSITEQENGASLNSKNNYSYKDNGDGTYTVTEIATVVMPNAGKTAVVTATLGSRTNQLEMTSLQAIESFALSFDNNDHAYFNSDINTLYIDRNGTVDFSYKEVTPAVSDDDITVLVENLANTTLTANAGVYNLSVNNRAAGTGVIRFSTRSGKTIRTVNVQICVPTTSYRLNYTPFGASASQYAMVNSDQRVDASIAAVSGKTFTISASSFSSGANDDIEYVLYTDSTLKTRAQSKYYTVNGTTCELSIDVAGTYYLTSRNNSKDNGKLERTLGMIVTEIYVSNSFPIQGMTLYKLDSEQNKTEDVLDEFVLYTNASASGSTYNLNNSLTVDPVYHTDEITYSSSNAKVAKVDSKTGVVTAVDKGSATIWVMSKDNASAITSVDVTVKIGIKAITAITKSDGSVNIPSGHIQQLFATTNPAVVDEPIYWSTSSPDVLSVDAKTGYIVAKQVTKTTPVLVYATTESGVSVSQPINVVPAVRVTELNLGATCDSESFTTDVADNHYLYSDYLQASEKNRRPIVVTADAKSADDDTINDEYIWTIRYEDGDVMSMEEAASAGLATITKNTDTSYSITPRNLGRYVVYCCATENVTAPKEDDPSDYITIDMLPCATDITAKDANDANLPGTIYLPVGLTNEVTIRTSTTDNNKTVDPPVYKILSGEEYIDVQQRPSADGEGVTYTIKGLNYSYETAKILFSSKSGSKSFTLNVNVRNNLDNAVITGIPASVEYTGKSITFDNIAVTFGGSKVDAAKYNVKYADNVSVGTASVTFTGKDEYNGSVRVINFKIVQRTLNNSNVAFGDIATQKLSVKNSITEPLPSISCNGVKMVKDRDFTYSYSNNDQAGTATLTINGIGNYRGSASTTFNIIDTAEKFSVGYIESQTYSGGTKTPAPTVWYKGRVLSYNRDYTLTYTANIDVGVATVTISGIGNFYSATSATFIINPKTAKLKSAKAIKKGFKAKWSKQASVSGYQLQYARNKKFTKSKKTKTVADPNTNTLTVKKLKKGKAYYVRVRSFTIIRGVKYYGKWSNVKKVKAK